MQVDLTFQDLLHQGSSQRCCCPLQVVLSFRAQQIKFQDEMERLKIVNVRIQDEAADKVRDFLQLLACSVLISTTDMVCVWRKAANLMQFVASGLCWPLACAWRCLVSSLAPCMSNMPRDPHV